MIHNALDILPVLATVSPVVLLAKAIAVLAERHTRSRGNPNTVREIWPYNAKHRRYDTFAFNVTVTSLPLGTKGASCRRREILFVAKSVGSQGDHNEAA